MRIARFCSILEGCLERFASWQSLFSRFRRMSAAESPFWKSDRPRSRPTMLHPSLKLPPQFYLKLAATSSRDSKESRRASRHPPGSGKARPRHVSPLRTSPLELLREP